MTDTVKLIIEIPKDAYGACKGLKTDNDQGILTFCVVNAVANGTPLDSNDSDYAEAQAYFDGQAYGWEEGRKDLCDKISAEIKERIDKVPMTSFREDGLRDALEIVEKYKKGVGE